jgi:hypothetical protein
MLASFFYLVLPKKVAKKWFCHCIVPSVFKSIHTGF